MDEQMEGILLKVARERKMGVGRMRQNSKICLRIGSGALPAALSGGHFPEVTLPNKMKRRLSLRFGSHDGNSHRYAADISFSYASNLKFVVIWAII